MDENAKRRLVGAAVLVALMVIFVPMLVDQKDDDGLGEPIVIPMQPDFGSRFDGRVEPGADEFRLPVPDAERGSLQSPPQGLAESDPASRDSRPATDLRPGVLQPDPPRVERETVRSAPSPGSSPGPSQAQPPASTPANITPSPPPARPAPPGAQSWVVQVASLSVPDAAERLRDELRGKGYPAFIEQAVINGITYHRVRVGPEVDRARAESMATAIGAQTGGTPLVQQYR